MSNKLPGWKNIENCFWEQFLKTPRKQFMKTQLKIGIEQTLTSIQQHNHFIFIH